MWNTKHSVALQKTFLYRNRSHYIHVTEHLGDLVEDEGIIILSRLHSSLKVENVLLSDSKLLLTIK